MRRKLIGAALALALVWPVGASAGPHIGMKLACKRYGEAFNSGSRSAVVGASTGNFAYQWSRMPADVFGSLPRGGGGQVLGSSKGRGSGTVTVATSQGVLTFLVVGHGFRWTVADIYKAGDDGRTVSLASYLDLTLTANEFMRDLKYVGGTSFHDSSSNTMRTAFVALRGDELTRIREFLPEVRRNKPYVSMNGNRGTMRLPIPNGKPHETITFQMVHEGGWKVDDYVVSSDTTKIPSFRKALPLLAAMTGFRRFSADPKGNDPTTFVCSGPLCDSLLLAKSETPFPLGAASKPLEMVVSADGKTADIRYPDRRVRIEVDSINGQTGIAKIQIKMGDRWAHLEHMLAIRRQFRGGGGSGLNLAAARPATRPTEPSVLTNASRVTVESAKPAAPAPTVAVATSRPILQATPAVAKEITSPAASPLASPAATRPAPVIQTVSYQQYSRREYKRMVRHNRRFFRR